MIVYRLETPKGHGVFTSHHAYRVGNPSPTRHPNPYQDGDLRYFNGWCCGFKNLNQLRRWFNKRQREKLTKIGGIELLTLEVADHLVDIGKFQVTFKRVEATVINRQAPNTI